MDDYRLQDPEAVIDHSVDWSEWLEEGETISTFTATITPDAVPTMLSDDSFLGAITTVFVSDVALGQIYRLKHEVTTNAGRTETRSLRIRGWRR